MRPSRVVGNVSFSASTCLLRTPDNNHRFPFAGACASGPKIATPDEASWSESMWMTGLVRLSSMADVVARSVRPHDPAHLIQCRENLRVEDIAPCACHS